MTGFNAGVITTVQAPFGGIKDSASVAKAQAMASMNT